jgi:hypothetical protein
VLSGRLRALASRGELVAAIGARDVCQVDAEDFFGALAVFAGVFRQYGHDVLTNQPNIFQKLAKAQAERDSEYTREINRRVEQP